MNINNYIGHPSQIYGVRSVYVDGGFGDGMKMLEVKNGKGLEFTVSVDRAADIPYLSFKGNNLAYIAPCGLVGSKYYDNKSVNFLKSFTAGFMTTCGLTAVGNPCVDDGEELPLHGTISHIPAENVSYSVEDEKIIIKAEVRDASIFSHKLLLQRKYICHLDKNRLELCDTVTNLDCKETPFMVLYHCNMGYPLLSENSVLDIPSESVSPRNERSANFISDWNKISEPTDDFVEQCYYHKFSGATKVSLFNPDINCKMTMSFNADELNYFTQWKMLGKGEYVMGLEPGNCHPDGRDVMRKQNALDYLKPYESKSKHIIFDFE